MAEYEKIEERIISGLGTIRIPDYESLDARRIVLTVELLRPPTNRYQNFDWFPPKELIARMTYRTAGSVIKEEVINYPTQTWYFDCDISAQTLISVQCAYKGLLQTFSNLGNALIPPISTISVQNDIKLFSRLKCPWDDVVFRCYADTAIIAAIYALPYDTCNGDDGTSQAPFLPTEPPPLEDPGIPIEVSPPYDENDVIYDPADIDDDYVPPPDGNACTVYPLRIAYEIRASNGSFVPITEFQSVYGQYKLDTAVVEGGQIKLECQGLVGPGLACLSYGLRGIRNVGSTSVIRNLVITLQ